MMQGSYNIKEITVYVVKKKTVPKNAQINCFYQFENLACTCSYCIVCVCGVFFQERSYWNY